MHIKEPTAATDVPEPNPQSISMQPSAHDQPQHEPSQITPVAMETSTIGNSPTAEAADPSSNPSASSSLSSLPLSPPTPQVISAPAPSLQTTNRPSSLPSSSPSLSSPSSSAADLPTPSVDPSPAATGHPVPPVEPMHPKHPSGPAAAASKGEKERFNYASFDCGAVVRGVNREASSATAILSNSKDQYMLNQCAASKFVEIELCDDILVDTIILANHEFFSSMFKDFKVFVADRYPPKKELGWTLMGEFTARNTRERQIFRVANPSHWARYLRIEFLTHYGHEFYCPLTVFKAFGTSMIEDAKGLEDDIANLSLPLDPSVPEGDRASPTVLEIHSTAAGTLGTQASSDASQTVTQVPVLPSPIPDTRQSGPQSDGPDRQAAMSSDTTAAAAAATNTIPSATDQPRSSSVLPEQPDSRLDSSLGSGRDPSGPQGTQQPAPSATDSPDPHDAAYDFDPTSNLPVQLPSPPAMPGIETAAAGAGTRESIFKTILKRLVALEKVASAQPKIMEDYAREVSDAIVLMDRSRARQLDQRFASCEPLFYAKFEGMLNDQGGRMASLLAGLEAKASELDDKLRTADRLIDSLDDQINWGILANLPAILVVFVVKHLLERALELFGRFFGRRNVGGHGLQANADLVHRQLYPAGEAAGIGGSAGEDRVALAGRTDFQGGHPSLRVIVPMQSMQSPLLSPMAMSSGSIPGTPDSMSSRTGTASMPTTPLRQKSSLSLFTLPVSSQTPPRLISGSDSGDDDLSTMDRDVVALSEMPTILGSPRSSPATEERPVVPVHPLHPASAKVPAKAPLPAHLQPQPRSPQQQLYRLRHKQLSADDVGRELAPAQAPSPHISLATPSGHDLAPSPKSNSSSSNNKKKKRRKSQPAMNQSPHPL
ncbi:UNC-like C-terminal-domain-containing protein [Entophlyctis helioformis]|nr:UNC-like C-terminal-domain-containing protein [Entophlyctis helioformis]